MREEMKGPFEKILYLRSKAEREQAYKDLDQETARRKNEIFLALKSIIKKKKEADPAFNLSRKALDELIKENSESFFGITSAGGVLRYWANELNYLKDKVDRAIAEDNKSPEASK